MMYVGAGGNLAQAQQRLHGASATAAAEARSSAWEEWRQDVCGGGWSVVCDAQSGSQGGGGRWAKERPCEVQVWAVQRAAVGGPGRSERAYRQERPRVEAGAMDTQGRGQHYEYNNRQRETVKQRRRAKRRTTLAGRCCEVNSTNTRTLALDRRGLEMAPVLRPPCANRMAS